MTKEANTDHPILDVIANRWSPYGFDDRMVPKEDLLSLLEAARWAPSSYNEQPWRYIIATKDEPEEYERLLSCLVEPNQAWAKNAPVLMLTVASLKFSRNGKPNRVATHDIGLASGNLSVEATARGLHVHQMAGILPDKARELYGIPEDYQPLTGIAIGYAMDPEQLPEEIKETDTAPRTRRPLNETVFSGKWENSAPLVS